MKFRMMVLILFLVTSALAQQPSVPEIRYESVPNPLRLPPQLYLGEAAGVAVNSKGHIFVYSRGGHTQLLEFDADGNFKRTIGDDLYGFVFAHAVRVDKDDNLWCVDEGSNMVIEFNPEGRVLMVFGRKPEAVEHQAAGEPSPPQPEWMFDRPTDVTWDAAGDIFVSDGYGNSRVVKHDKDGNWVKAWGKRGTAPGEFHTPHSIVADAQGNVYVADRENSRIQVFDADGNFLKQWTNVGAPWALCITPGPHQVLYSSDSTVGRIYKLDLSGNLLGAFGKPGKQLGQFGWVHEMACPSENLLYVSELLNWRVQKLILQPGP
jgi:DNA-binding beta-propeller fold protein YncE